MSSRAKIKAERLNAIKKLLLSYPEGLTKGEIAQKLGLERSTAVKYITELEILPLLEDQTSRILLWEDEHGRIGILNPKEVKQNDKFADVKWKGDEPYIVSLIDISGEYYQWLLEDTERLKQINPDQFQQLIADRLSHMGLAVQLVGDLNRKDGGLDLIAYPQKGNSFPFLLGVQVKHHRTERKTGSPDIRDLYGVLNSRNSPFHCGMIVTNTSFTADAKWFASNNQTLLRLRDLSDLRRWLNNDYTNENEWREIPRQIEVAPGVIIKIPRPHIIIPS